MASRVPKSLLVSSLFGNSYLRNKAFLHRPVSFYGNAEIPKVSRQKAKDIRDDVLMLVNDQVASNEHGRLFAVVQLDSTQFKVTDGDIIVVEGAKRYDIGDRIRLEKVLCVGCRDFTLFGRPLIPRDAVDIEATVIEKTLNETHMKFFKAQRKAYHNAQFFRNPISLLRINRIELIGTLGNTN